MRSLRVALAPRASPLFRPASCLTLARTTTFPSSFRAAERKSKLRQAQGDAKREIDEFKASREARLRTVQPEAEALAAKVARLAGETDRKIASLEAEYQRNKEPVLQLIMQVVMSIDNPHAAAK